jgi:hypothetical protein
MVWPSAPRWPMAKTSSPQFMRGHEARLEPGNLSMADVVLPAVQRARGVIDLLMNVKKDCTFPGSRRNAAELAIHELLGAEEALRRLEEWREKERDGQSPRAPSKRAAVRLAKDAIAAAKAPPDLK